MTFRHFRPPQPGNFGSALAATFDRAQPVQIAPASAPNPRSTMTPQRTLTLTIAAAIALVASLAPAFATAACPFCSAVSQTIRQESEVMDAVLIAEATDKSVRNEETGAVEFKVVKVIKGADLVKVPTVTAVYYGDLEAGRRFLVSGVDPPDFQWSCMPLTKEGEAYVLKMLSLPNDPLERVKFAQGYLQHPEQMLSRDAYDEFATTPYPVIQSLKPFMNHDELVKWVADPEMPADRRRLYLTLLGVCGTDKDAPMLEKMLTSSDPQARAGLDALIACYLLLAGEPGLKLIDKQFLANPDAPYAETYSAIMALRFHGTEADKIPRSTLVKSLYHVLDRKDLADLVIPDLARWGDWSQIDRLVKLFTEAEADNNWVRVPVVNYLRACPKPEAAAALEKLKEIDPESVRRASSFFTIPTPPPAPAQPSNSFRVPDRKTRFAAAGQSANPDFPPLAKKQSDPNRRKPRLLAAGDSQFDDLSSNPLQFLGVTSLAIAMLSLAFYLVLTGGSPRLDQVRR